MRSTTIQAHSTCARHPTHLNARACLRRIVAGECSMVKRASEVTNVERSMGMSSSDESVTAETKPSRHHKLLTLLASLTLILFEQHRERAQQRRPGHVQHGANSLAVMSLKEGDALRALPASTCVCSGT